jgi:hypothetical protein
MLSRKLGVSEKVGNREQGLRKGKTFILYKEMSDCLLMNEETVHHK